ncbi:MAG TPA: hypothetical protein VNW46_02495 [Gemmatimonadaceae bacterium]|jgi:hypothetical protein|nr:hypothetical protein [Gemmatimonadaceae bacterium]
MRFLWTVAGATKPEQGNTAKRKKYKVEFQKLWVAGTLGALFTAVARNLPLDVLAAVHWFQSHQPFQIDYTLDRVVRYGYLFWLLTYFFTSSVELLVRDNVQKWDIPYDLLQSACTLIAAFFLGFIVPDQHYGLFAYAVTAGAIAVICLFSLIWFGDGAPPGVNRLRAMGLVLALICLVVAYIGPLQTGVLCALLALLVGLALVLWAYICVRLDAAQPTTAPAPPAAPSVA